jgi:hypothetical protein
MKPLGFPGTLAPMYQEFALVNSVASTRRAHSAALPSTAWPRGQTLIDFLLDAGIHVPHSCREGRCGSCVATVLEGEVDMAACDILEPEDLRDGPDSGVSGPAGERRPARAVLENSDPHLRPLTGNAFGFGTDCGRPLVSPLT